MIIAENHRINLIFGYEDSMELFTTIIMLNYEIDGTRDNSTLLLCMLDCACLKLLTLVILTSIFF